MDNPPALANVASLLADPSRSEMLVAMMDGRYFPVSELATIAHVTLPTASHHLALLVEGGLVEVVQQGRHRYHRLASIAVADLIEQLGIVSLGAPLLPSKSQRPLLQGRVCYNHLAGKIGVHLRLILESSGHLRVDLDRYGLTELGVDTFKAMGLNIEQDLYGKVCLDWTERVPHIGGKLGVTLFCFFEENGWVERSSVPRQICLTKVGKLKYDHYFPGLSNT